MTPDPMTWPFPMPAASKPVPQPELDFVAEQRQREQWANTAEKLLRECRAMLDSPGIDPGDYEPDIDDLCARITAFLTADRGQG